MAECPECTQDIGVTQAGRLRAHKVAAEQDETRPKCPGSAGRPVGAEMPPEAPSCEETPTPTHPATANSATCGNTSDSGDLPSNPTRDTNSSATKGTETLPGIETYQKGMEQAKAAQPPMFDQPAPLFSQPRQPTRRTNAKAIVPMEGRAAEVAGRLKEMFHAYSNRLERSQQATMGPSEAGSPCDRRIAMSLLRLPAVNPGGDNWASFVGTCVHSGLEDMFLWANAGSGRYQTEVKLEFPSKWVPFGTTDLIDTALLMIDDHKLMGTWSLNKLRTEGPSRTYRVQGHIYAYGARLRGWDIKDVAIIGWPREKSSLDDLYVWTEPYDPNIAREALDRVARIGTAVVEQGIDPYSLPIDPSDCRFCPFYLKGAATSEGGVCNGRT